MPFRSSSKPHPLVAIIAVALVMAGLYFGQEVLVPLAVSILLVFLLGPLANRLERLRLGRVPSALIAVVAMLLPLVILVGLMGNQIVQLTNDLSKYEWNLRSRADSISKLVAGGLSKFEKTAERIEEAIEPPKKETTTADSESGQPAEKSTSKKLTSDQKGSDDKKKAEREPIPVRIVEEASLESVGNWLGPLLSPLGTLGLISVMVLFMLLEREDLRNRAILLVGRSNLPMATKAIDEAGYRVSKYLRMQLLVNSIYGVAIGLMVWLLGLPNPWFWAITGTGLRFIPYIGPWVTAGGIFLLSLAVTDGWWVPGIVIVTIAVLELIVNNALEPWLYGSSAGLTSVAVIFAAVFWTWLWGAPGLFLSTPLTVCICVLGRHLPQFEFAAILLSDSPPLPPESRFYQRLLAVDDVEAKQVVEKTLTDGGLEAVFDKLLLPTLNQAESDFRAGDLTELQRTRLHEVLLDTAESATSLAAVTSDGKNPDGKESEEEAASQVSVPPPAKRSIVCVPSHGLLDEIGTDLVAEYLGTKDWEASTTSDASLCSEVLEQVEETQPQAVLLSSLSPFVDRHARYLAKRLRKRFPSLPLIIGLWKNGDQAPPSPQTSVASDHRTIINSVAQLKDVLPKG